MSRSIKDCNFAGSPSNLVISSFGGLTVSFHLLPIIFVSIRHLTVLKDSVSPAATLKRKSLRGLLLQKNACKIKKVWQLSSEPAERYFILLVLLK